MGLLTSLRILDFSTLLPGPFGTMLLADMGADIIRVESPSRPDLVRMFPPIVDGVSVVHAHINRSKRSLSVDLKSAEGVALIKRLVADYDVVVEQFRPGVMAKLSLDYDTLKVVNPELIYCSISGYGQTGPYRDRAGHDINYLSVAGVTSYNGTKESGPTPMGLQIADIAGGAYHAVMAILAAVVHRNATGEGQYIDVSLTDAVFSMQVSNAAAGLLCGVDPKLEEEIFNGGTFYGCYETKDGRHFSIAGIEPHFFQRLCNELGFPELGVHALTPDPDTQAMLKEKIAAAIKARTFEEWQAVFKQVDACAEPVLIFSESCRHPQIQHRRMVVGVPGEKSAQQQVAFPVKFSTCPPRYAFTGANLGAHTHEILEQAGYGEEEIAALKEKAVVTEP